MPSATSTSSAGSSRLRVRLQQRRRFRGLAVLVQVVAEQAHRAFVRRVQRDRAPQRVRRGAATAEAPVQQRELDEGGGHVRPAAHDLLAQRERARDVPRPMARDDRLQHRVELDQPLGVVVGGEPPRGRGRGRSEVAERGQPLAGVRRFLAPPHAGVERPEARELRAQVLAHVGALRDEVPPLAGIVVERVQLRQRQVDELRGTVHHSVQRAPSRDWSARTGPRSTSRAAPRWRRRRGAAGSGRPASSGTGSPSASRTVGTMSTWPTVASIVRHGQDAGARTARAGRAAWTRRRRRRGSSPRARPATRRGPRSGRPASGVRRTRAAARASPRAPHPRPPRRRDRDRPRKATRTARRRPIRRVRIVEMDPGERRPAVPRGEPVPRQSRRLRTRALGEHERAGRRTVGEPVVVDVEAAVEPETRLEGKGAHESARAISRGTKAAWPASPFPSESGTPRCRARRARRAGARTGCWRGTGG